MKSTNHLLNIFFICFIAIPNSMARIPNYCQNPHCQGLNLACTSQGNLSNCPRNAKLLEMTKYKNSLADIFNTLRNDVAGGKYRNLPKAARMGKMTWSNELAMFARLDVSRCRLTPRPCMSSPFFYYIGHMAEKIIFLEYETDRGNFAMMTEIIDGWLSEITGISRTATLVLPSSFDKPQKYKTALIINERSSQFGCAALRYTLAGYKYFYFSCAFATDNLIGRPIYKWGAQPGDKCQHKDKTYANLCWSEEDYENNKYTQSAGPYTELFEV
ncbi:antigen 5 like allergen Cul n 1 [Drosophila willistoni]|nr:antigen 5 like allergen Cul n 1 [Drosophila willistoni]